MAKWGLKWGYFSLMARILSLVSLRTALKSQDMSDPCLWINQSNTLLCNRFSVNECCSHVTVWAFEYGQRGKTWTREGWQHLKTKWKCACDNWWKAGECKTRDAVWIAEGKHHIKIYYAMYYPFKRQSISRSSLVVSQSRFRWDFWLVYKHWHQVPKDIICYKLKQMLNIAPVFFSNCSRHCITDENCERAGERGPRMAVASDSL